MPSETQSVIAPPFPQERSVITMPSPLRWLSTLVALPVAALLAGSATLFITRTTTTAPVAPSRSRTSAPEPAARSTDANTIPTTKYAHLFTSPDQPAYTREKGFSPDARRILDVETLQDALVQYQRAKGRYPRTIADLFPVYAPLFISVTPNNGPMDPVTHRPYEYQPSDDGTTYRISAMLSNGERYTGRAR